MVTKHVLIIYYAALILFAAHPADAVHVVRSPQAHAHPTML